MGLDDIMGLDNIMGLENNYPNITARLIDVQLIIQNFDFFGVWLMANFF